MALSQAKSKFSIFLLLVLASTFANAEATGERRSVPVPAKPTFTGAWSNFTCLDREREQCGGFILYLAQNGDRVCGEHFSSTMGYGQINEGMLSISGQVQDDTATIQIKSGRSNSVFKARMHLARGGLDWALQQAVVDDQDDGVIPERGHLAKSPEREMNEHLQQVIQQCK